MGEHVVGLGMMLAEPRRHDLSARRHRRHLDPTPLMLDVVASGDALRDRHEPTTRGMRMPLIFCPLAREPIWPPAASLCGAACAP